MNSTTMTITELIDRLERVREQHGGLIQVRFNSGNLTPGNARAIRGVLIRKGNQYAELTPMKTYRAEVKA